MLLLGYTVVYVKLYCFDNREFAAHRESFSRGPRLIRLRIVTF